MHVSLEVPGPDLNGSLQRRAQEAWDDLAAAVQLPITASDVAVSVTTLQPTAKAWSKPLFSVPHYPHPIDIAQIILSRPLLSNAPVNEVRLTLLHECIHMRFAMGPHRARWIRIRDERQAADQRAHDTAPTNIDLANFMLRRHDHAFTIVTLPDEIVAEQYLKDEYTGLFQDRAEYYRQMRIGCRPQVETPRSDRSLQPFAVFHELLRNAFFRPLLDHGAAADADLERLEQFAETRLGELATADLNRFLTALKPRLLNVRHDAPLDAAEIAYSELFDRVMALTGP
jgi:hypothetical protein